MCIYIYVYLYILYIHLIKFNVLIFDFWCGQSFKSSQHDLKSPHAILGLMLQCQPLLGNILNPNNGVVVFG